MSAVKFKLDAKEVERALTALPPKLNERVRKKAIRATLNPARNALRALWKAAPYKGKPLHRKAIASATKLDVRRRGRGPSASTQFALGVQYGRKGGASAKGRQRVWHLLEHGFRHRHAGRVPGANISSAWVQRNQGRLMAALQENILTEAAAIWGNNAK